MKGKGVGPRGTMAVEAGFVVHPHRLQGTTGGRRRGEEEQEEEEEFLLQGLVEKTARPTPPHKGCLSQSLSLGR